MPVTAFAESPQPPTLRLTAAESSRLAPFVARGTGGDAPGRRRMPETLSRYLVKIHGGKQYLPTAYRLVWFRDAFPDWGIATQLLEGGHEAGFATVQASILNAEGRIVASGMKTETRADFPAGWVEKAETGAIGRALAVAGFGTQFSPELDEARPSECVAPEPVFGTPNNLRARRALRRAEANRLSANRETWAGPGLCPSCHAPEGKPHGTPCTAGSAEAGTEK